jgi:hypothetical protein
MPLKNSLQKPGAVVHGVTVAEVFKQIGVKKSERYNGQLQKCWPLDVIKAYPYTTGAP